MIKLNHSNSFIYIYIGFNDPKLHKRGVENIILLQSKALPGRRVFYIFFGPKTTVSKWGNIAVISIKKFNFLLLNLILNQLKKKYKSQLFIHSHNYQLSFFCLYKTDVFTVHDGITYLYKKLKRKFVFVFSIIEFIVYQRAKKIHFISQYAQSKALYSQRHNHKAIIIYNSTPLEDLSMISNSVTSEEKVTSDEINIFCVRSIEERARIDLLIDVCIETLRNGPQIKITVAGKGPLLEQYKKIVADKHVTNLNILGYISDDEVISNYKNCDLVIMPSEYGEGFGLPVIEGYLFGKPVIASDKCAIPEIIIRKDMLFKNTSNSILELLKYFDKNKQILSVADEYLTYYKQGFSNKVIIGLYKQHLYDQ